MTVTLNGIAHIQLSITDTERGLPFWEKLCNFLDMKTLLKSDDGVYCIGSRTGVLARAVTPEHAGTRFDQNSPSHASR